MRSHAENWTSVTNWLFDELMPTCSPTGWMLLAFICRKTYGWRKRSDRISLSQFQRATGLARTTVIKSLGLLVKLGLINHHPGTRVIAATYSLAVPSGKEFVLSGGTESVPRVVQIPYLGGTESVPTKETITKEKPYIGKTQPFPSDFHFTESHRSLAEEFGLNVQAEFEAFRDYHLSKASKFADWSRAFNSWLRKASEFRQGGTIASRDNHGKQRATLTEIFTREAAILRSQSR